jgi:hypothetical protein
VVETPKIPESRYIRFEDAKSGPFLDHNKTTKACSHQTEKKKNPEREFVSIKWKATQNQVKKFLTVKKAHIKPAIERISPENSF